MLCGISGSGDSFSAEFSGDFMLCGISGFWDSFSVNDLTFSTFFSSFSITLVTSRSSAERLSRRCSNELSFIFRNCWLMSSNIAVIPLMPLSATSIRRTMFILCHMSPAAVVFVSLCKSRACWTMSKFVGTAPRASTLASRTEIFLSSW